MFGELVKKIRAQKRLGLREFCLKADYDPSNWSKIERGILSPPQDDETLKRIAFALGVTEGTKDWEQIYDSAKISAGKIPEYVLEDEALVKKLPLFFRTVGGKKPTRKELEKLARVLREP